MFNYIRNNIIAGLFVTIPLLISIIIIIFIYEKLTSWSIALFIHIPWIKELGNHLPFSELIKIISLILILFLVFFVGILARNTIGGRVIAFAEWFLMKVPMFNIVYSTMKHIGDAIRNQKNGMFRKVVLFEYPRKGIYSVGFVTNEKNTWEVSKKIDKELISVFLPTTPNPTSGYLLLLPKDDLIYLEVPIADAMRLIISGGAITPTTSSNDNISKITLQKVTNK
jgi:uncharacterized membrane protein